MLVGINELSERSGATIRQIDYWCRAGVILPVGNSTPGSGHYRQFDESIVERVELLVILSKVFRGTNIEILGQIYERYEDGYFHLGNGMIITWR